MPDDYYVSQYSGEEIDDLLGKAGSATGAVRYDAAQSLTDEQKAQARTNIGADTVQGAVRYDAAQSLTKGQKTQARGNISALNGQFLLTEYGGGQIGWYRITEPFAQYSTSGYLTVSHAWANGGPSEFLLGVSTAPATHGKLQCLRSAGQNNSVPYISNARLVKIANTYALDLYASGAGINNWDLQLCNCGHNLITLTTPTFISADDTLPSGETLAAVMEYQNPPMLLGVEYKTTERYLGKPVYVMAFQFGALPNTSDKEVAMPETDNTCKIFEIHGYTSTYMTLPGVSGTASGLEIKLTGISNSAYVITGSDRSSATATIVAKYTKTTD